MTSETDAEFVADMEWLHSHDREAALPPEKLARLFALARRGAADAARIEQLEAALRYALENGVCTQYWGDDDDCGTHGCCGEVSYKPHDAKCWTVKARAALEDK